jgi:ribose transport system ATP-binding protein
MRELREQGIAILYISHRLQEVFEVCDRVTVFKDGAYISTMNTDDITTDDIIVAMVGRSIKDLYPAKNEESSKDEELLRVKELSGFGFKDISFSLTKGEILGFAGLVGAGRSEIMRGLCGIDRIKSGSVHFDGQEHRFKRYRDAVEQGICYLTEDRKLQGLFLGMSIKKNISSANLKAISSGPFINRSAEEKLVAQYVEQLAIKVAGIENPISSLSGGNQQKCLLGKWLSINPRVIIMDEPTRGIDVGAKLEIYTLLRTLAEKGVGIIIISSELPEVIGLCDRVAVIHEGDLAGFVKGKQITEENIMKLASGGTLEKEVSV